MQVSKCVRADIGTGLEKQGQWRTKSEEGERTVGETKKQRKRKKKQRREKGTNKDGDNTGKEDELELKGTGRRKKDSKV